MGVRRFDHVGVVVDDIEAAAAFLEVLGFEREGSARLSGAWVDAVVGLDGIDSDIIMLRTPDGGGRIELSKFHAPADESAVRPEAANRLGIRHVAYEVDDLESTLERIRAHGYDTVRDIVEYEDIYRLCFVRGPEGLIIELAQPLRP